MFHLQLKAQKKVIIFAMEKGVGYSNYDEGNLILSSIAELQCNAGMSYRNIRRKFF